MRLKVRAGAQGGALTSRESSCGEKSTRPEREGVKQGRRSERGREERERVAGESTAGRERSEPNFCHRSGWLRGELGKR
jgi:hypothetical protein